MDQLEALTDMQKYLVSQLQGTTYENVFAGVKIGWHQVALTNYDHVELKKVTEFSLTNKIYALNLRGLSLFTYGVFESFRERRKTDESNTVT